jgi:hypothetical protein
MAGTPSAKTRFALLPGHDEWGWHVQLRGADIGGGPIPIDFFGFSVPT